MDRAANQGRRVGGCVGAVPKKGVGPMVGARAPERSEFCNLLLTFLEGCLCSGGGYKGSGGGVQVGGRGTGPRDGANFVTCVERVQKRRTMMFFEGYPVGWEGVQGLGRGGPGALVPGG